MITHMLDDKNPTGKLCRFEGLGWISREQEEVDCIKCRELI